MTQQQLWLDVLAKVGGYGALILLIVGGVWKAFQHLSGKWLDNRFAEKLKAVEQKHDVMVRHPARRLGHGPVAERDLRGAGRRWRDPATRPAATGER